MQEDLFYKKHCIFVEEKLEDFSEYDKERLAIIKDLYKYTNDFRDVFCNIGNSSIFEVKDVLFNKVNGIDVMEAKINHVMATLYSVFTKQKIEVKDNDLHNVSMDSGNPDILLNNALYLEGKRIPFGFSKYNRKKKIINNCDYTIENLLEEIERQINKYKKSGRVRKPDILSIFIPMYMNDFIDYKKLLYVLSEAFFKYVNVYNSNYLFSDICFFINIKNEKVMDDTNGELLFISLNREVTKKIDYSIKNIIINSEKNGVVIQNIVPKLKLELNIYNKLSTIKFLNFIEMDRSHLFALLFNEDEANNSIYGYGDVKVAFPYASNCFLSVAHKVYKTLDEVAKFENSERDLYFKIISSILIKDTDTEKDRGFIKVRLENYIEKK